MGSRRRNRHGLRARSNGERAVGQYPDATPEEALAYFERKYVELNGQVTLLEQRAKGGAPAADIAKTVANLTHDRGHAPTRSATSPPSRSASRLSAAR